MTRESNIELYLVQEAINAGGEVRKVKWIGRRGAPDRLLMLPATQSRPAQTIWVELKATGAVAKPHQLREHTRMRSAGQRVEVIDSFEGVDLLIGAINQGRAT